MRFAFLNVLDRRVLSTCLLFIGSSPAFAHGDPTPLVIAFFSQVAIVWVLAVFSFEAKPRRLQFFFQGFVIYMCAVVGSVFLSVRLTNLIMQIHSSLLLRDILGWLTMLSAWLFIPIGSIYLFRRHWRHKHGSTSFGV